MLVVVFLYYLKNKQLMLKQRMLVMKLWITEHVDEDGAAIGPYIKAENVAQANRIAIQYGLLVLGEIQELQHDSLNKERIVH
jgi:hypothetical protein